MIPAGRIRPASLWAATVMMSQCELKPLLSGDRGAWEAFVNRYAGVIFSAVRRTVGRGGSVGPAADTRDVAQDVFVRLVARDFAALRRFDSARSSLSTFLTVIARNVAIDHLRRGRTRVATVPLSSAVEQEVPSRDAPVGTPSPRVELPAGVLSARQEVVLRMLLDEGMSVAEAADVLGIEAQTVRSTKHKAVSRLRQYAARQDL